LCLRAKKLLRSHIIPAFLIEQTEDWIKTGRAGQAQPHMSLYAYRDIREIYCKEKGNVLKAEGLRERLLCADCEGLMQIGENYARECLYGRGLDLTHTRVSRTVRRYKLEGETVLRHGFDERWVDYDKFKRFQISIIWRACVARGRAFKQVTAPPSTVEQMRLALLRGDFEEAFVPCAMQLLDGVQPLDSGMVAFPFCSEGIAVFVMGGYVWNFFLGSGVPNEFILKRTGHLRIAAANINLIVKRWNSEDPIIPSMNLGR
jgi:hypothetical protein